MNEYALTFIWFSLRNVLSVHWQWLWLWLFLHATVSHSLRRHSDMCGTYTGDNIKLNAVVSAMDFFNAIRNFYSRLTLWLTLCDSRCVQPGCVCFLTHFSSDFVRWRYTFFVFNSLLHFIQFVARNWLARRRCWCFIMHKLLPVDITAITHFCCSCVFIFFSTPERYTFSVARSLGVYFV